MIIVKNIVVFDNGMCAIFDEGGAQIPELQGKWEESRKLLRGPEIDLSQAEWNMDFSERMKFDSGL